MTNIKWKRLHTKTRMTNMKMERLLNTIVGLNLIFKDFNISSETGIYQLSS